MVVKAESRGFVFKMSDVFVSSWFVGKYDESEETFTLNFAESSVERT